MSLFIISYPLSFHWNWNTCTDTTLQNPETPFGTGTPTYGWTRSSLRLIHIDRSFEICSSYRANPIDQAFPVFSQRGSFEVLNLDRRERQQLEVRTNGSTGQRISSIFRLDKVILLTPNSSFRPLQHSLWLSTTWRFLKTRAQNHHGATVGIMKRFKWWCMY